MCVSSSKLTSFPLDLLGKLKYLHLTIVSLPQAISCKGNWVSWLNLYGELQFGDLLSFSESVWICNKTLILDVGRGLYLSLVTMCVCQLLSHVWLFATQWTGACQAPLSTEFPTMNGSWSRLQFLSPEGLPYPGTEPMSLALQVDALPSEPPGKPLVTIMLCKN